MSLVVGTIEELEHRLNAFGVALVGAPLGRQLIEALARAEKAEAEAAASWQFAELARVKAKEAGDRAFRASERANSAERERDAMHAAAEELRAQGAELGEDAIRESSGRQHRMRIADGLLQMQAISLPDESQQEWWVVGDRAVVAHNAEMWPKEGWPDALVYFDAHRPLLPDECREQGKPPRKMVDGEVRLLDGAPTTLKMRCAEVVIAPVGSGRGWWWHPRWHGDGQVCTDHPANDPSQVERIIAFWARSAPADLCLTGDGRSVRTMATNEVRDVVTGKGLVVTVADSDTWGQHASIDGKWIWNEALETAGRESNRDVPTEHPCSLPSNRLRVEAFLAASTCNGTGRKTEESGGKTEEAHGGQRSATPVQPGGQHGHRCQSTPSHVQEVSGDPGVGETQQAAASEVRPLGVPASATIWAEVVPEPVGDGVTDDTEALQHPANTGRWLKPGVYRVTRTLEAPPRPPCIPSHIADTDWTVIEGRAVWRGQGTLFIAATSAPLNTPWANYQSDVNPSLAMQCDVPQSLFLAARRWMGWEKEETAQAFDARGLGNLFDEGAEPESLEVIMLRVELDIANDSASRWEQVARDLAERIKSGGAP